MKIRSIHPLDLFKTEWDVYPRCGYVYVLTRGQETLYVGRAFNPNYRLRKHRVTKSWWSRITKIITVECRDEQESIKIEKHLIRELVPIENQVRYVT